MANVTSFHKKKGVSLTIFGRTDTRGDGTLSTPPRSHVLAYETGSGTGAAAGASVEAGASAGGAEA
jgi:hypothetical protein